MMNSEELIRKDCTPLETIEKIKKILNDLNLETEIKSTCVNGDCIYSCRLVIKGTDYGTNGKGVKEEYSLASAYAEFMERLQTRYIFKRKAGDIGLDNMDMDKIYEKMQIDYKKIEDEEKHDTKFENVSLYDLISEYFPSMVNKDCEKEIKKLISQIDYKEYPKYYYHVNTKENEVLPDGLINMFCGSNGLCAGNSKEEAISQGICEIFERFAIKDAVVGQKVIPTIPESCYKESNSMEVINFIKSKNYEVIVKDFTMGGKFPIVGILLIAPNRKRVKLCIGSDLNFDIALQRCLTEVMQGRKLDGFFPIKSMSPMYDLTSMNDDLRIKDELITGEMLKCFTIGEGELPVSFLLNTETFCESNMNVFKDIDDNKLVCKELENIALNNNMEVYIKDFSIFGFPTYRVFIKDKSSVYADLLDKMKNYVAGVQLSKIDFSLKNNTISQLLEALHNYNITTFIDKDFRIITNELSAVTNDTRELEILLLMKVKRYKEAYEGYSSYFVKYNDYEYIALYIHSLMVEKKELLKTHFSMLQNQHAIDNIDDFIERATLLNDYIQDAC